MIALSINGNEDFRERCVNTAIVSFEAIDDGDEIELRELVAQHLAYTDSAVAASLLADWDASLARFVKVMPNDYRRVLNEQAALAGVLAEVG